MIVGAHILAAEATNPVTLGWQEMAASLSLVALAIGLSLWRRLGLERPLIVASVRAAAQLVAVGLLFTVIFDAGGATAIAWVWVAVMVAVATFVVRRRAPQIQGMWPAVLLSVAGSTGVSLGLVFALGVFDHEPVTIVVIAGITVGNVLPAAVLAAQQLVVHFRDEHGQVEALLALGHTPTQATAFIGPRAARTALVGQIERTKVVGIIALPGAMTGLLLAGVEPIDAVLVQLIVMYLILGSAAVAVTTIVWAGAKAAYTPDHRLAPWTSERDD